MDMYRARFFGGKQARNLEGEGGKPSWKMEANNLAQNARDSTYARLPDKDRNESNSWLASHNLFLPDLATTLSY